MSIGELRARGRQAILVSLCICVPALAQQDDAVDLVELPDFMLEKVAAIDEEKIEFLRGPGIFSVCRFT